MNPTQNKDINVHEYPEGADKRTLLAYRIAVMQAFYDGKKIEVRATQKSDFLRSTLGIPASVPIDGGWHLLTKFEPNEPEFNWSYHDYRIAKIAEGHNPDKLTPEQVEVSKGYRLLTADEIKGAKLRGVEYWHVYDGRWAPVTVFGRHHAKTTYRTKAAPGAYLPNPKPRYFRHKTGLFPVNLTAPRNYCVEIIAPDTTTHVFLDGTRKTVDDEYARWSIEQAEKAVAFGDWVEFDGNMDPFRPKLAIGYNPANVTEDQIPAGWRLFSHWEKAALGNTVVIARFWEGTKWSEVAACVLLQHPVGTLITQKPDGFYLKKPDPKIAAGHNPAKLTEEQVGVSAGWRTLSAEEHDELGACTKMRPGLEWWTGLAWNATAYGGGPWTYRTKAPVGEYLPKPAVKPESGVKPGRYRLVGGFKFATFDYLERDAGGGWTKVYPNGEKHPARAMGGLFDGFVRNGMWIEVPATKSVTRYKRIGGFVGNEKYLEVDNESRAVTLVMNDGRKIPVNHCYSPESCERYVAAGSWEKEVVEVPKQT